MEFKASRFVGLFSWTKFLMPDTIEIRDRGVSVTKKKFFGLSNSEEEVRWSNISSIRTKNGIMLATLVIETSGGATSDIDIKGMAKGVAKKARTAIQERCDC